MLRSTSKVLVLVSAISMCAVSAFANSGELLDFQELGNLQAVGNFYNGGSGLSITPNYGVTFSSNFYGLRAALNGGAGNFASPPLNMPAIFMNGATGSPVMGTMNVTPGFSTGLNFYFTAGFTGGQTETVTIWSGMNGTGTVLAIINLANNNGSCSAPAYCSWSNIGASFTGTAHSVTFSGPANELGIADITIGASSTAIPEPSPIYLFGTGVILISLSKIRRMFGA